MIPTYVIDGDSLLNKEIDGDASLNKSAAADVGIYIPTTGAGLPEHTGPVEVTPNNQTQTLEEESP